MDDARTEAALGRWRWLPWGLLAVAAVVASTGAWLGSRSFQALEAHSAQLEREATESEAHVAQLQTVRQAMERRLRALERQQQAQEWSGAAAELQAKNAEAQHTRREAALEALGRSLKDPLKAGDVTLSLEDDTLSVEVSERILFAPAGTALTPEGAAVLKQAAAVFRGPLADHRVAVEAHTDEVLPAAPGSPTTTAWELSAARAVAVVRQLGEREGLAPERLSATGHAAYRPRVPNDSPPHRASNRRVTLRLSPTPVTPESAAVARTEPPSRPSKRQAKAKAKKTAQR
ncbi:OmpA family protein [Corallococcus carmarthensis]|uniref:Flagellar motor protein MotB n=1 Tax=Corallococcus carmarthensis TaxID=2316728 RepID=A0A3A8KAD8_9BACT|nr:OmpA family protein [Corallococcus carmarthensis]NOK22974.1 OmpA family protein [Corallococcus carmarthensis]RKG99361.1 flagellar motor protein MotB [Corallococcus carmarthensis]